MVLSSIYEPRAVISLLDYLMDRVFQSIIIIIIIIIIIFIIIIIIIIIIYYYYYSHSKKQQVSKEQQNVSLSCALHFQYLS